MCANRIFTCFLSLVRIVKVSPSVIDITLPVISSEKAKFDNKKINISVLISV